jgi:hypothetical protein
LQIERVEFLPMDIRKKMNFRQWNLESRICLFIYIILGVGTFLLFWPVRQFEFINFDDPCYMMENPWVLDGLTLSSIRWAFSSVHCDNWHPIAWLSHMLDYELFGLNPGPHHLVSVFIHALNSILLFLVLRKMTSALWSSAFVAAVFAWHPAHVEAVAWISERKELLSTFWKLLIILLLFMPRITTRTFGMGPKLSDWLKKQQ